MFQILFTLLILFTAHAEHDGHEDVFDDQQIKIDCEAAGTTERLTNDQLKVATDLFATRAHRLQHSLWHSMRASLTTAERRQVVKSYGALWGQFHPLCPPPQKNAGSSKYNPAGEDFFYMHHQMMMMFLSGLLAHKQKCVTPWTEIPDPGQWPISGVIQNSKTPEALEQLRAWDREIKSVQFLRSVSLSQLGWALEFTIHNNLHVRYATDRPAARYRSATGTDGAVIPLDGKFAKNWLYDELGYNWLADPYASATNATFWKIHGYVDHILFEWLEAHGKDRAAVDCEHDSKCYTWRGTWVGAMPTMRMMSMRAFPALKGADPAVTRDDIDFLRRRLANQRLGEIKSGTRGTPPGRGRTHEASDILGAARQAVCP